MWSLSNFIVLLCVYCCCFVLPSAVSIPQGQQLPTPSIINSRPCNNHEDCLAKWNFTECSGGGFCLCAKGHVEEAAECLPVILELNSEWSCKINAQCTLGGRGLSRCNERTRKCECYDVPGNGRRSTAYFPHACYYRKALGDSCHLHEECQVSIRPKDSAVCDVATRRCVCAPGATCTEVPGSGNSLHQPFGVVLFAVLAIKILQ